VSDEDERTGMPFLQHSVTVREVERQIFKMKYEGTTKPTPYFWTQC
jgi:hypothetical protein